MSWRGVGADRFVGGQMVFSPEENAQQIRLTRQAGALGTVLWNFRSAQRSGVIEHVHRELYQDKAPLPAIPRLAEPGKGIVLGNVMADSGEPLVDASVSLRPVGRRDRRSAATGGHRRRFLRPTRALPFV